jgi:nicotinamide riboside kinase
MIKIGFVGGPSAGKTSLSRLLSTQFIGKYKTELVSEYAREWINLHGQTTKMEHQLHFFNQQCLREKSLITDKVQYLITDSPVHLGIVYAMLYNDNPTLLDGLLQQGFDYTYDYIFHLPPNKTPENDGTRQNLQLTKTWQEEFDTLVSTVFSYLYKPTKYVKITAVDKTTQLTEVLREIGFGN